MRFLLLGFMVFMIKHPPRFSIGKRTCRGKQKNEKNCM